jgi:hypothetical protein
VGVFALRRYHHPCQHPVGQTVSWPPVLAQAAELLTGTENRCAVAVQFESLDPATIGSTLWLDEL